MNSAYKHLEAKLRIGELTLGQWAAIFIGVMAALMWGMYVSPFGEELTLLSAVYVGGLPATLIVMASATDFDLALVARSAVRWRRMEGRHLPGPGSGAQGYTVTREAVDPRHSAALNGEVKELDLAMLWDS